MEIDAFEAVQELKGFYEGTGILNNIKEYVNSKRLDIGLEYSNGTIKLMASHPLRIYTDAIYKILSRLYFINSTALTVDMEVGGKKKSISKRFGQEETLKEIVTDLLEIPHERVLDVIVDTDEFKLVEMQDLNDTVSIVLKRSDSKTLFRSLINYLFPFVSVSVEKTAKEEIMFTRKDADLTVDLTIKVDGAVLGIKSKKVKLVGV